MNLSWITIVWSAIASACLTVALVYLGIWFKRSRDAALLPFPVVALSVGAIAVCELAMMRAQTVEQFGAAMRWGHVPVFALVVSVVAYVLFNFRAGSLWLAGGACALRFISLVLNFYFDPNLNYAQITSLQQLAMPWGEFVSVAVGTVSPRIMVGQLSSLLLLLFLVHATLVLWRRGSDDERRHAAIVGGSFALAVMVAAGHAALVHAGVIKTPYLISLPFLLIVVAMGYKLSADVVRVMELSTQLRTSEAELRHNKQRVDTASAAARTGIWEWDIGRNELWVTEQGRALFGFTAGERLDLNRFLDKLHPDDRESVRRAVNRTLRDGGAYEREYRIVPAPGEVRWVSTRGTVDVDPAGQPVLMRGVTLDISERRRAQESMARLAAIVESSTDAIVGEDLQGIVSSWNAGAERIFGYSADEMIGHSITKIVPPDIQAEEHELLSRIQRGERVENYETIRSKKGGALIAVSISMSPVRDGNGVIVAASKIARDISERKLADAALRESESRFRAMADTAPVLIWMAGADKLCTYFNQGWLEFTGRTLEQEMGNGWAEGVHREDVEHCLQVYDSAFDARQKFTMEYRLRTANGEYRWIIDRGAPRFAPDGRFLGYIGSCIDISELKRSDELLRRERAFLRQVIDVDPNLIFAKNRAGQFTLVNQAVADVFGTTVENIVGKTDADFSPNVAEIEHFRRIDLQVMDTLKEQFVAEEPITTAKGKVMWLQTVKRPIVDERGTADQVLGSATDITRRREAEFELALQRNELAHLSRVAMLGELSGSLAHELNQPLTAILSNAQAAQRFLARDDVDLDEVREILKDIVSDDKRAGEVISGLRLLLTKGQMQSRPLDLNHVVSDVLRLVRSDLLNSGVIVNTELMRGLPRANGDRVQLQQVLINLVVNGCEAMSHVESPARQLVVRTALTAEAEVCL